MKLTQKFALSYLRAKLRLLSRVSKKKAAQTAFDIFCTPRYNHKRKTPKVFEEAETLQFRLEGNTIHGWRWNHPATRKVLILHGFESSAVNFEKYIRPLIKRGYEVLAFDAPAHGISGGKTVTAPHYKRMILEIQKKYGPIQSFMAHSFGGLALSLAMEEMEHDPGYKMALIAPATETSTAIDEFFRLMKLDGSFRPEFEEIIVEKGGVTSSWYSVARAIQRIRATVLWIHDKQDHTTPLTDVLAVKEKNYPNVDFLITDGLGHRRIYRDPHIINTVVEFL